MSDTDGQHFCLKWNNFQNNIMSQFETLKEDEDFVDVTFSCHGRVLKAHKVVLSACSPYLKTLFKDNPCKHPIIILEDVSINDLESLLAFAYTGQVHVAQNELSSFLKAAESLQIKGLTDSPQGKSFLSVNPSDSVKRRKRPSLSVSDEEVEPALKTTKKNVRRLSTHTADDTETFEDKQTQDWMQEHIPEHRHYSSEVNTEVAGVDGRTFLHGTIDLDSSAESRKPHSLDPRPCPLCNRVYSNLSNLRQHMRLIHNPTLVTCKLCCKTFKTDLYLRRHLVSYHELNLNPNPLPNSFVSIETVAGHHGAGPSMWPRPVKPEPTSFKEVFTTQDVYQVPQ